MRARDSARGYDSHSSSTLSSEAPGGGTKPPPPPVAVKPSLPHLPQAPASQSGEDPASRSFMGKVKAFEQMDHLARAQRMLELQEAEQARVSTTWFSSVPPGTPQYHLVLLSPAGGGTWRTCMDP